MSKPSIMMRAEIDASWLEQFATWQRPSIAVLLQQRAETIRDLAARVEELELRLNPRFWNEAMSDAWHRNIPDMMAAFEALRAAPADGATASEKP